MAESDALHIVGMAFKGPDQLAGLCIPDLNSVVPASRCNILAVRAECDAAHTAGMAFQCPDQLASRCIPDLDSAIVAARCDRLPIRAEIDRNDLI